MYFSKFFFIMFCCVKEFLLSKFFLFRGAFFRHFALNTCFSGDFSSKKEVLKQIGFLQNLFIFEKKNMITRSHRCVFFEKKGVWLVKFFMYLSFSKMFSGKFCFKMGSSNLFFYSAFLPKKMFSSFSKFFLKCFFGTVNSRGFFFSFFQRFFSEEFFFSKDVFFKGFVFFERF